MQQQSSPSKLGRHGSAASTGPGLPPTPPASPLKVAQAATHTGQAHPRAVSASPSTPRSSGSFSYASVSAVERPGPGHAQSIVSRLGITSGKGSSARCSPRLERPAQLHHRSHSLASLQHRLAFAVADTECASDTLSRCSIIARAASGALSGANPEDFAPDSSTSGSAGSRTLQPQGPSYEQRDASAATTPRERGPPPTSPKETARDLFGAAAPASGELDGPVPPRPDGPPPSPLTIAGMLGDDAASQMTLFSNLRLMLDGMISQFVRGASPAEGAPGAGNVLTQRITAPPSTTHTLAGADMSLKGPMPSQDLQHFVSFLGSHKPQLVQGTLALLTAELHTGRITLARLIEAGFLPRLALLIRPVAQVDETARAALRALTAVVSADKQRCSPNVEAVALLAVEPVCALLKTADLAQLSGQPPQHLGGTNPSETASATRAAPDVRRVTDVAGPIQAPDPPQRARSTSPDARDYQIGDAPGANGRPGAPTPLAPDKQRSLAPSPDPMTTASMEDQPASTVHAPVPVPNHITRNVLLAASVAQHLAGFTFAGRSLAGSSAIEGLVHALDIPDRAARHTCLVALHRILRVGSHADNLLRAVKAGAMPRLLAIMTSEPTVPGAVKRSEGIMGPDAMPDLATALLLDMALLPDAPNLAVDTGVVKKLVKRLALEADPDKRMSVLLILARLACHSLAVQLDAVRLGAVPPLVERMKSGRDEDAMHASRLLAILAQSAPTHQALTAPPVLSALTALLSSPNPLVVEHATSVFAVMANNPDTHFEIVGWGVIPLLVAQLSQTAPSGGGGAAPAASKTHTYALATLLLVAMHEPRHADVVTRSGALPHLVQLMRTGAGANVQEYAAAVISCLCRSADIQADIIGQDGLQALVELLAIGSPRAKAHAAEALVHFAVVDAHRPRLVIRAAAMLGPLRFMLHSTLSAARHWGAALLLLLCQEDGVLQEVAENPDMLHALSQLLADQRPDHTEDGWRALVQACWVVSRLCEAPEPPRALATAGLVRSLVHMLGMGWESVQRGTGGALHNIPRAEPAAAQRPTRSSITRIEPLDSNAHAAAAAALLSLCRAVPSIKEEVDREMLFQEAWCGRRVRLNALSGLKGIS